MAIYETSIPTSLNAMRAAEIWLHEKSTDSPSIRELADYLGYSEAQIRRNFNRFFGVSPGRYRDSLRLERAAVLLCRTPMQVLDVAISCGYRSHAIFTRAFHSHFGMSPSDYRRRFHDRLRDSVSRQRPPDALSLDVQPATRCFLTRHYGHVEWKEQPRLWRRYAQPWQHRLKASNAMPVWLYHDDPNITPAGRVRIDFGFMLEGECRTPPSMAFRQVRLPARRVVKMRVHRMENVPAAFAHLLYEWMPANHECISGEPITITWQQAMHHHQGTMQCFEFGVPLLTMH